MKIIALSIIFLSIGISNSYSQFTYKWDAKFLSFTSSIELTRVNPNSTDDFNWQNDEYAVEISAFGLGYYQTYYSGGAIKKVANAVAEDASFYDIEEGDSLPLIESGYYMLAKTPGLNANEYASVIVVVGFNEFKKIYFEARIFWYLLELAGSISVRRFTAFIFSSDGAWENTLINSSAFALKKTCILKEPGLLLLMAWSKVIEFVIAALPPSALLLIISSPSRWYL